MTITVQAGITIASLQELIAAENLCLPVDVPRAGLATLGGTLATNVSGPRRLGYGTLRDYVIGITAINDEGREFKAGGRVVKNVAGYDLCKLLVGSLGTLGIITQVTLKLRPPPEEHALVTLSCANGQLGHLLDGMHASRTRPVCVEVLNRAAAEKFASQGALPPPAAAWTIVVGFEGNGEAVNWQVQQLVKEASGQSSLEALVGFPARPLWQALCEGSDLAEARATFKACTLPSATADFCRAADETNDAMLLCAHAGNGIVVGHLWGEWPLERAAATLAAWRERASGRGGHVIVERCPAEWKSRLSVWGPPPASAWLMREVKRKLDPRGLFNPGRFVDGI